MIDADCGLHSHGGSLQTRALADGFAEHDATAAPGSAVPDPAIVAGIDLAPDAQPLPPAAPVPDDSYLLAAAPQYAALPVYTNDQIANVLTSGGQKKFNVTAGGTLNVLLTALNPQEQVLARAALQLWSDVSGINFREATSGIQIQFTHDQPGAYCQQFTNGTYATIATVNIATSWLTAGSTALNDYGFQTYLHEIGHALGLSHAGNYNGSATYSIDASYANDCWSTTLMSYFSQSENTWFRDQGFNYAFVETPMIADILAMRKYYGGNNTLRTSDTVYGYNSTAGRSVYNAALYPAIAVVIEDDGGIDTLDYSGSTAKQRIDLNPEVYSNVNGKVGNLMIARGSVIENAIGGSNDDVLIGNGVANVLKGGAGNDSLQGGAGDDKLLGGLGADALDGGAGFDYASYADGVNPLVADLILTGANSEEAYGDTYTGIEGLIGTQFGDSLRGDSQNNWIYGGGGADYLYGRDGADVLLGEDGVDSIYGNNGNDALYGGAGNDRLSGGPGADVLDGGAGLDFARYDDATVAVVVDLANPAANTGDAAGDLFVSIEGLSGSPFADSLWGDSGDNVLYGGDGADTLVGRDGNDTLLGEDGNDLILGGNGNDLVFAWLGADTIDGGAGFDIVTYADATQAATADLINWTDNAGAAAGDTYAGIEGLAGTAYADSLRGDGAANMLYGLGGDDWLYGRGGNDRLVGEAGADVLDGGDGYDTASYEDAAAGIVLDLQYASLTTGDALGDSYFGIEEFAGSAFDDSMRGDAADNALRGGGGQDWLYGRDGQDSLFGEDGNDTLLGGNLVDWLYGGSGNDRLAGGAGGDLLDGGTGFDYASYMDAASGVVADLQIVANNTGDATGDIYVSLEGLIGGDFNDSLRGDAQDNWIYGVGGADYIFGRDGNDSLLGGDGDDTLFGNAGIDALYGESGDDRLYGGAGADLLNGGAGFDLAWYDDAAAGLTVDMATPGSGTGDALGDLFVDIEGVVGSNFADTLRGNAGTNWLYGGAGNDVLQGMGGDDFLAGGAGGDQLDGGLGVDFADYSKDGGPVRADLVAWGGNTGTAAGDSYLSVEGLIGTAFGDVLLGSAIGNQLRGGAGNDWLYGRDGDDVLTGGSGADVLDGGAGSDAANYGDAAAGVTADLVLPGENSGDAGGDIFVSIESLVGSAFADSLRGDAGGNLLIGGGGDDWIYGRGGNDAIQGDGGNDVLFGGAGDDMIWTGSGNDQIWFGVGDGKDTVNDFAGGTGAGDVLYLAKALGVTSFAEVQGKAAQVGANTVITFDAGTVITLAGVTLSALSADDFAFY